MTRIPLSRRQLMTLLVAIGCSVAWFTYNILLSPSERGLTCCDAAEYISQSMKQDVWWMAGPRVFGYPFFLSLFFRVFRTDAFPPTHTWLVPALAVQLAVWLVSCGALYCALRRTGRRYPWIAFVLLVAHPTFSSYAAMTLTDSLATSLFCLTIAAMVFLQTGERGYRLPLVVMGITLGLATTMRPSFQILSLAVLGVAVVCLLLRNRADGIGAAQNLKRCGLGLLMFGLGFLPFYGKLVHNCYSAHGYVCVLDTETMKRVTGEDMWRGITGVRWWSSLTTDYRSTDDTFVNSLAGDCKVTQGIGDANPYVWLLRCYARVPLKVPILFLKKFTGGYDNYFLNAYATDETTTTQRDVNRLFSLVGFLGLFMATGACAVALVRGRLLSHMYLVVPVVYAFAQVNSHVEPRYFFPTYPIFFLFAFSQFALFVTKRVWAQIGFWTPLVALTAFFYVQTWHWDMRDCWFNYSRVRPEVKRMGLMLACPPEPKVLESLQLYGRYVPTVPPLQP